MFEKMPINEKKLSAEELLANGFETLGEVKSSEKMAQELQSSIDSLENPKFEGEDSEEVLD